ncbi:MAG: glycosyltransferase, partial [Nanoarchaeota archaeon]|nr:glycosyltransferase [Nanoarchaeota archaeon]
MKIAFFTDTYYPEVNGVTVSILKTTEKLAERGHKIMIFCPRYKKKKGPKHHRNIRIQRSFATPLLTYKEVQVTWPNYFKIIMQLRKFKPDLIHLHTPGPISAAAIISAKVLKKPLIGTFHTLVTEQLEYLSLRNLSRVALLQKMLKHAATMKHLADKVTLEKIQKRVAYLKSSHVRKIRKTRKHVITFFKKHVEQHRQRSKRWQQEA